MNQKMCQACRSRKTQFFSRINKFLKLFQQEETDHYYKRNTISKFTISLQILMTAVFSIAQTNSNMLKNGNFIKLDGPKPANWIIKNSSGSSGTVTLDRKIFHSDGISMRMVKTNDQGRFDLMQTLNTSYLQRSRKVEFSAWVYAENVNKGYLIASAGSKNKKYMVWKYFRFNGTFEWRKISLVVTIPQGATRFDLSLRLTQKGIMWIDDCSIRFTDQNPKGTGNLLKNPLLNGASLPSTGMPVGWRKVYVSGYENQSKVTVKDSVLQIKWLSGGAKFSVATETEHPLQVGKSYLFSAQFRNTGVSSAQLGYGKRVSKVLTSTTWKNIQLAFKAENISDLTFFNIGTGTVEYRNVKLLAAASPLADDFPLQALAMPPQILKTWSGKKQFNTFTDIPVPLTFLFDGHPRKFKKGTLEIDLPEELRIVGAYNTHLGLDAKYKINPVITPLSRTNGRKFNRWSITNPAIFKLLPVTSSNWGRSITMAIVPAKSDLTGKSFTVNWRLRVDGNADKTQKFELHFLPKLHKVQLPKKFKLYLWESLDFYLTDRGALKQLVTGFEKAGLNARKRYGAKRSRAIDELLKARGWRMYTGVPTPYYTKRMRPDQIDELKPLLQYVVKSDSSMDKNKLCPEFFIHSEIFRRYMESYIKKQLTSRGLKNGENVFLDIEPWHPMDWCFCDSCRTSFAKTYQLKTTPSAQQILKQYSDKWSEFRCAQTAAIIGLIANTCRKFYPDVKIYNYDYVLDFRDPKYRQRFRAVANDSQLNEQYFDAHVSSYYSIVDKYACDMMDINVRNLKKEYIVLGALDKIGYLARERVLSPKRMRMMLLAAACNGANGFGLFPGNYIDGLYLQMFNQSMKLIAELEDFFNNGTRVGTLASLKPRPYVVHNININNKITTITRPKWNDFFAFRVHKTDSKTLISLFNYHPKLPLFVDLNLKLSPGKYTAFNMSSKRRILPAKDKEFWSENTLREFHAKVPSMDVAFICFRPYHTTDTALPADLCTAFNTEFEHEKSKFDFSILNPIESNGLKVIPDVLDGGIPAVTIQSKHQQILINPEDSGAIISWQTDGKTLFGSHNNVGKQARFMGIGRFYLPARYRRDDKAQKCKIISAEIINGCATLKLRRIQENLIQIDKIYQLRNDSNTLEIDWKLKNIGKTALKIAFWVHNYPTLGTWDNPSTKLKFKVSNGKEKQIFKQPVAEFFPYIDAPPTVSGPGKKQSKEKLAVSRAEAINAVTGAGIRFDAVHEQLAGLYVWSSLNPTLEWIYKEIKLAPGNEWSTKLRLTPFKSK